MKGIRAFLLLVLLGLFLFSCKSVKLTEEYGKIEELEVSDYPFDDGTGISLAWKPLSKEHRIIEYRIYRGFNPDSLFLTNRIEVDAKLGVIGDKLYYYDKDFQVLYDMETAPPRLEKEKQQKPGSPLYKALPRDPGILEKVISHYSVAGLIKPSHFYHKARKIQLGDGTALAGYPMYRFSNLFANPIPGNEYFYTVLAVNEQGKVLPYADIKSAVPINNRPDTTAVLHPVYLSDTNEISLEYFSPVTSQDIGSWQAWLLPKQALPLFDEQQALNQKAKTEGNFIAWQSKAIQLCEVASNNPYFKVSLNDFGLGELNAENLENYTIICGITDYEGLSAFCQARQVRVKTSIDLPTIPAFKVLDKPDDKGDYNLITFGKPFGFVVTAVYANDKHTRIKFNYELSTNDIFILDRLNFEVFSLSGEKITAMTEYFIDKTIEFTLPDKYLNDKQFNIVITPLVMKDNGYEKGDPIKQDIIYDQANRRFEAGDIILGNQNLSRLYIDVATRSKLDPEHNPGNRINGFVRFYDAYVGYESDLFKSVLGVDPKTKNLLLDPSIIIEVDSSGTIPFYAKLFRDEFEKDLSQKRKRIDELKQMIAQSSSGVNASVPDPSMNSNDPATELAALEAELSYLGKNPSLLSANKQKSNKGWLKKLLATAENNTRSISYKVIVTDGHGLFNISEVYKDEDGGEFFYPVANLYNHKETSTLIGTIIFTLIVIITIILTKRGKSMYIRPIPGLEDIDNAVGRATEMGRPIMFVPGWGSLGEVCTISALMILNQIARKSAEYDTRLISPHLDFFVLSLAQEVVRTAYSEIGRPDAFNQNDIFYVSDSQFVFASAVNGLTIRERVATVFYMGYFNAEALIMTEIGNQSGAIQIAGTDSITQVPFFITSCDYTLIGEEFYAASAYLSKEVTLISMLKASDYIKLIIVFLTLFGTIVTTLRFNHILYLFPVE